MKKAELEKELKLYKALYEAAIENGRQVGYDGWGGPRTKHQCREDMDAALRAKVKVN